MSDLTDILDELFARMASEADETRVEQPFVSSPANRRLWGCLADYPTNWAKNWLLRSKVRIDTIIKSAQVSMPLG